MTWKLTEWGKTRSGVPGIPWRDLTDKEFHAAESLFEKGELKAQGYFEKAQPEPEAEEAAPETEAAVSETPRRGRRAQSEAPAESEAVAEPTNDHDQGPPPAEEE